MENLDKNIVAISTPIGNGGISIIRMSGKSVAEIADKVFFAHTKVSEFEPRKLYLGTFKYEDICDKCMCITDFIKLKKLLLYILQINIQFKKEIISVQKII